MYIKNMIPRQHYLQQLTTAVSRSPVTALIGPRQCGKTTLARQFGEGRGVTFLDLESPIDQRRLQNPEMMLRTLSGLIVLDEIQRMPELFNVLRVLVDRPDYDARFLILGSASPDIIKNVSESLAGRIEFVELSGFHYYEIKDDWTRLWLRGGFPRSFLAESDENSYAWREGFIRTFLERDIPQLGISIPAVAMRRFWMMLAAFHGQIWNATELGRSMGLSDKTVRSYLDILTGTYMVRQLQPWFENIRKRQVKSPKIFLRDSGLLHSLLTIPNDFMLRGNPKVGASWEGFAMEQVTLALGFRDYYYWATYSGAELDLLVHHHGKRFGVEFKFTETPQRTKSMVQAIHDLNLAHIWIITPGEHTYPIDEKISVCPLTQSREIIEAGLD
ncbi:ATP-binding protein [candidate division CSSED10-310 bacterium]|uniref:ATP-binding protein n=1 Tax=candidate division CSSED10-310 bacterium TaxID=2855610 RepID=A0ABV6YZ36_UNCC1